MNPKPFKSPTGSQPNNQFKNVSSQAIEEPSQSCQRLSDDLSSQEKNTEPNLDTLKVNNKKTLSAKLAFLLDVHPSQEKKSALIANTLKNFIGHDSTSPLNRHSKSRKASDAKLLQVLETPKTLDLQKKMQSSKTTSVLEQNLKNQLREKKHYLGALLDETETSKAYEGQSKLRKRADSIDGKRNLEGGSNPKKKDSQKMRKLRKNYKLTSIASTDQYNSNVFPQTHLSCNFSQSPENSVFLKSMAVTSAGGLNKGDSFHPGQTYTPKQAFFGNGQYVDYYNSNALREKIKAKNNSISEAVGGLENSLQNARTTHHSLQQHGHRKIGSTSASIAGFPMRNTSQIEHTSYNFSPSGSVGVTNPHSIERNISQSVDSEVPVIKEVKTVKPRREKVDVDMLVNLKSSFDTAIAKHDSQIVSMQNSSMLMKKIRQEYESVIQGLMADVKKLKEEKGGSTVCSERDANTKLLQENLRLQKELAEVKMERDRLQSQGRATRSHPNSSPSQSVLPTEKRVANLKHDSPPLTKHLKESEKAERESVQLKQIVLKQQNNINLMKKKEAKMMRLIYAIRKQGVDVEKIYNEEVKGKFEHLANEETIPTVNKEKGGEMTKDVNFKDTFIDSVQRDELVSEPSEDVLELDSSGLEQEKRSSGKQDVNDQSINHSMEVKSHNKLNPMLKNKLKLDFTALNENDQNKNRGTQEPLGFHEEFMSKFEEFSLSWRQLSKLQKINSGKE